MFTAVVGRPAPNGGGREGQDRNLVPRERLLGGGLRGAALAGDRQSGAQPGAAGAGDRCSGRAGRRDRVRAREARGATAGVQVRQERPRRRAAGGSGRWVLMQPWEWGSLPKAWLPMVRRV